MQAKIGSVQAGEPMWNRVAEARGLSTASGLRPVVEGPVVIQRS
jgi:hypothetical protein